MSSSGLRERKKQKTRWAIQEHALRLFAQQGYEATTVEQIAAAAEISPSTFFRYFPSKEDLVIQDQYDDMMIAVIARAKPGTHPIAMIRQAVSETLGTIGDAELAKIYERTRLNSSVPALRARMMESFMGTITMLAGVIATATGREPDDRQVRTLAGASVGALLVAITAWVESEGAIDFARELDEALAELEGGFPGLL